MTVAQSAAAILADGLDRLIANEERAAGGADPEGVHQLRVAIRRLRSALALFGPFVPEIVRTTLDGELAWFSGMLAPARELDVFLDEIIPAAQVALAAEGVSLATVAGDARRQRGEAYARVVDTIRSERYRSLKDAIQALQSGSFWRAADGSDEARRLGEPTGAWAARVLDKLHARTLKRGRRFRKLDPAGRHKVRVAAKRLRYAADFFADLYRRKAARRYAGRLRPLQEELGRMNDLATLHRLLDDIARSSGDATVEGGVEALRRWGEREYATREPGLLSEWRRFKRAEPFWSDPKRQKAPERTA
jgi:CHAD domain-containing protein